MELGNGNFELGDSAGKRVGVMKTMTLFCQLGLRANLAYIA